MNRPPRRARSPSFVMSGHTFDPSKHSTLPIDYNDMDRQHNHPAHNQNQAPYPYNAESPASSQSHNYHLIQHHNHNHQIFNNNHHGISNNNSTFDQTAPNNMNSTKNYQYHHNQPNYPANYHMDQHLPTTYRSSIREQPLPTSSPPPSTLEPNSIYKILCITNINPEVCDGTVKEAISNEFSRFGDNSVSICHDGGERLVYIYFKTFEEARDARHSKLHTILFDRPIDIEPIYEQRPSPGHTPQAPLFPGRRRSITPPEYYHDNGNHHVRRVQGPIAPPPMMHHEVGGYLPYSHRYPNRTTHPPPLPMHPLSNPPMPYADRHYSEPVQYQPQYRPYSPPPGDPHRQFPNNPTPSRYSPAGSLALPVSYGHPHYRERERPAVDPYYSRGQRSVVDPYHAPDHRPYPPTTYPRSQAPATGYSHLEPSAHVPYRPSNAPSRRSPVYPDPATGTVYQPNRFSSRDFRRDKFRENPQDRDESKPSRVIFVTNIDPSKIESEIKDMFEVFGVIEDLEVKKINPDQASAIIKFSSMDCAYRAKTSMNGKYIGTTKARISYGKVNTSRRLWLGGLGPTTTLELLDGEFSKFGDIISLDYVSGRPYGYIEYGTPNQAQFAVMHLKGTLVAGADKRIRMEYVDSERKEESIKNETNSQTSSKTSQYRGNEIWNNNESELCEQVARKRSISPNDLNTKRIASTHHESETAYYDSNRASTSSPTKSSNRSSPSSPTLERSVINDAGERPFLEKLSYGLNTHDDGPRANNQSGKKTSPIRETFTEKISKATTIESIVELCEVSWNAQLILRNFNFNSTIYMCSGNKHVIDKYITSSDKQNPILRITQRWRLHPQPKLEENRRHMQSGNLGIFIIKSRTDESLISCKNQNVAPGSKQNGQSETSISERSQLGETIGPQPRPLKNLISYLEQKDAAGVVSVSYNDSDGQDHQKLLYTFPPCEFALNILKTAAPQIGSDELSKDEFLIGILVGTIETKS